MHREGDGMEKRWCGLVGAGLLIAVIVRPAGAGGETDFLRLLGGAEAAYATVQDYTATLRSRERVQGILEPEKEILLKFQRPFQATCAGWRARGRAARASTSPPRTTGSSS